MKFKIFLVCIILVDICSFVVCEDPSTASDSSTAGSQTGRWSTPLITLKDKQYYFAIYFKANWFHAYQYCRKHGMDLLNVLNQDENDSVIQYILQEGLNDKQWWTSGTKLEKNGPFVWMGNGSNITYTNWAENQPDNLDGNENCLQLVGTVDGVMWNDRACSSESFFICESL